MTAMQLNRAGRRQNARALLVPPEAERQRSAQQAEEQQREAQRAQRRALRDNYCLQTGSLAIAFLAQVDVHRDTGEVPKKAARMLELIFERGCAEILTDPDEDEDEDDEDEEDEEIVRQQTTD